MQSRAKLFGHPIHQMLIVLPLGLLVMAVVFDVIDAVGGRDTWSTTSYWNIIAGVITGLVAAAFGLVDWLGIPGGTRAKRIGTFHGLGNVVVVALFAFAAYLRAGVAGHVPSAQPFVLELCGLAMGAVTGWLGGELVDRLGVGVDDGANVNAPNSLTHDTVVLPGGNMPGSARRV